MCEVQELEIALSHWEPQDLLTIEVNGEQVEFEIDTFRQDPVIVIYGP
jgi:hypothetical protein